MCLEIHRKRTTVVVARESTIRVLESRNRAGSTGCRNPENKKERQTGWERERQVNRCRIRANRGRTSKLMDRS